MIDRGGARTTRRPHGSALSSQDSQQSQDSRLRARRSLDDSGPRSGSRQPLRAQWDPVGGDRRPPRRPRPTRDVRKQSRLGRFVARYGWRAYAVPVLAAVTVFVMWDAVQGDATSAVADGEDTTRAVDDAIVEAPIADGNFPADLESGVLPDGGSFTESGAGTWRVLPGSTEQAGFGERQVFTYTVEIEDGVDTTAYGGDAAFARMVDETLADPRSWTADRAFAFRRVDSEVPDFRVSLTSQMSIRQFCGFDIELEGSCFNPGVERVLVNEPRWVRGAVAFHGDIGSYRQYLVNHEVGHAVGYPDHEGCTTDSGLAPIMMQQTYGTANDDIARLDPEGLVPADGKVCRYNPWPFPRGA
ncbi:DUF3152 domain-containing protein [Rhodococcus artemisiae]|uniref:DUF3152 domain-containing protein n=1 Tax=Rhodococcus artemisiae TaxID=714159 RepID=UPI0038B5EE77